jgi:hypothetical protein
MITSFSRVVTSTSNHAVLKETGLRPVVSSTMMPRHSLCGLTKKINLESSPCKTAQTSAKYSSVFQLHHQRLKQLPSSRTIPILVTSQHAQPTSELVCVPPSTSSSPSSLSNPRSLKQSLLSTLSRFVVPMVSTPRLMMVFSTFQT